MMSFSYLILRVCDLFCVFEINEVVDDDNDECDGCVSLYKTDYRIWVDDDLSAGQSSINGSISASILGVYSEDDDELNKGMPDDPRYDEYDEDDKVDGLESCPDSIDSTHAYS